MTAPETNWYSDDTATFGDRVAAAREARGLSQQDLAKRLGVSPKTVEGWENDMTEPRSNKLATLSGLLNVSIRWLLTGDGQGVDTPESERIPGELVDMLSEMRVLRAQIARSAEQLAILERRLSRALSEAPE